MQGHRKIAVSLPVGVVSDLDLICGRLNVTRSALLTGLLQGPVRDLVGLSSVLQVSLDSGEKVRRFRGESIDLVTARLAEFQDSLSGLDAAVIASPVKGGSQ